jgi:uncharacterized protein
VQLASIEKAAVSDFCARVRARFGSRVREITLFGSRARGDGDEESDIDVCVVIDELSWQEKGEIDGITAAILDAHDVVISPFLLSTEHMDLLRRRERLIAREIASDGIPL